MSTSDDNTKENRPGTADESTVLERPARDTPVVFPEATLRVSQALPSQPDEVEASKSALRDLCAEDYLLQGELGRGGMGEVLHAQDLRLGRNVAIKRLIGSDAAGEARFVREMLVTARLQHPSIVPIYDAGRWEDGTLVYAMRKYDGLSLAEHLAEADGLPGRLALLGSLIAAAEAVAYAHQMGVIHRDLKPANIILGAYGETVVIDWGLAKVVDTDDIESAKTVVNSGDLTGYGDVMGTPHYMSPEQTRGDELDGKTDVYGLGACFYELLTGAPPFGSKSSKELLFERSDLVLPSPKDIEPNVPSELDAICRVATTTEAAERCTAKELVEDLRRYQAGALVAAHSYSRRELVARWVLRHRLATAIALVSFALLGLLIVRLSSEVQSTRAALDVAAVKTGQLTLSGARGLAAEEPIEALQMLSELADDQELWARARVIAADAARRGLPIALAYTDPNVRTLDRVDDQLVVASDTMVWVIDAESGRAEKKLLPDLAEHIDSRTWLGWEGNTLVALDVITGNRIRIRDFDKRPTSVSASADGSWLAYGEPGDMTLEHNGEKTIELVVSDLVVSPLGTTVASSWHDEKGFHFEMMDLETRKSIKAIGPLSKKIAWVRFIDGEDVNLSTEERGQIVVRRSGAFEVKPQADAVIPIEISPAGVTAFINPNGEVSLWGPQSDITPRKGWTMTSPGATGLALHHSRPLIAVSGAQGFVWVWNMWSNVRAELRHPAEVRACLWLDGAVVLFTIAADGWVRRWKLTNLDIGGIDDEFKEYLVANEPRSRPTTIATNEGNVRTLSATGAEIHEQPIPGARRTVAKLPHAIDILAVDPSGRWLIAAARAILYRIDLLDPTALLEVPMTSVVTDIEFAASGDLAAVGDAAGSVYKWEMANAEPVKVGALTEPISGVAIAGARLAAVSGGAAEVVLFESGQQRSLAVGTAVQDVALDPTGQHLALASTGLPVILLGIDGSSRRTVQVPQQFPKEVTFSPSGQAVAAFGDGGLSLFDRDTGEGRLAIRPGTKPTAVAFSPDGSKVWLSDGNYIAIADDGLPRDRDTLRAWLSARLQDARLDR